MEQKIRVHRVGTITTGLTLVAAGVLFILQLFVASIDYTLIFHFWPMILIGLGIEILLSNFLYKELVYDKGAVIILIIMMCFAVCMASADVCFSHFENIF